MEAQGTESGPDRGQEEEVARLGIARTWEPASKQDDVVPGRLVEGLGEEVRLGPRAGRRRWSVTQRAQRKKAGPIPACGRRGCPGRADQA